MIGMSELTETCRRCSPIKSGLTCPPEAMKAGGDRPGVSPPLVLGLGSHPAGFETGFAVDADDNRHISSPEDPAGLLHRATLLRDREGMHLGHVTVDGVAASGMIVFRDSIPLCIVL